MKHSTKAASACLAALVVAVSLAACGSSSDGSDVVSGEFELVPGAPPGYQALAGAATLERSGGGTTTSLDLSGLEPDTGYVAHLHVGACDAADPGGEHFKFDPAGSDEPPNEIHLEFTTDADGNGKAKASSQQEVPIGKAGSVVLHQADGDHMTSAGTSAGETVFVHEGHHHGEEQSGSAKLACAELEAGETGSADNPESASMGGKVPTVVIRDGEPVGGIEELEYSAGDEIRFEVTSDVADEVHVHGYDLMQDVAAGGTVSFDFPAEIEGIFEVELEGRKEQIAELRVNP
jgi:hypothetical protein